MTEYVTIYKSDDYVTVMFQNEAEKPLAIGEKMCTIHEEAYMNGYNWGAFFQYYLTKHAPEVLEGMDPDPEAGSYVAHYKLTPENEEKAEKFMKIICSLLENEEELYRIVREEGDAIEWD